MESDAFVSTRNCDWQALLEELAYAYGRPALKGRVKTHAEDFRVTEIMGVEPSGEGEHYWLKVSKTKRNTEQVARELAVFSEVRPRDVGYAGMKDFQAVTTQWFSVWKPQGGTPDWAKFDMTGVQIESIKKHSRKIKRGAHTGNIFDIRVRNLEGDINSLNAKLERIREGGVPNYFGAQRFGRAADNMNQAYAMLIGGKKVKNRNLRGILMSAARSWLFNQIASWRVTRGDWQELNVKEPANLDGSNSIFSAENDDDESSRLQRLDIHPTAPMFGEGAQNVMRECSDLHQLEMEHLAGYSDLIRSLEAARTTYQRRAIRSVAHELQWSISGDSLSLTFRLQCGQFATSVLREILVWQELRS